MEVYFEYKCVVEGEYDIINNQMRIIFYEIFIVNLVVQFEIKLIRFLYLDRK